MSSYSSYNDSESKALKKIMFKGMLEDWITQWGDKFLETAILDKTFEELGREWIVFVKAHIDDM